MVGATFKFILSTLMTQVEPTVLLRNIHYSETGSINSLFKAPEIILC